MSDSPGDLRIRDPGADELATVALRALQSGDHTLLDRNPIDVTPAGLRPDLLRGVIRELLASATDDALVVIVGSSGVSRPELMAGVIEDCLRLSHKPVLAYASSHAPEAATLLRQLGVPAFVAAESCTAVLAGMLQAGQWRLPETGPGRGPGAVARSGNGAVRRSAGQVTFRALRHTLRAR